MASAFAERKRIRDRLLVSPESVTLEDLGVYTTDTTPLDSSAPRTRAPRRDGRLRWLAIGALLATVLGVLVAVAYPPASPREAPPQASPGRPVAQPPPPPNRPPSEPALAREPDQERTSEPTAAAQDRPAGRGHAARAAPGTLNLLTLPACDVALRGTHLGRTPLADVPLPPGRHLLTLTPVGGGASRTIVVRIRAGQQTHRTANLATLH